MTQEEKQLLIKDICARLPYDIEAQVINNIEGESKPLIINKTLTFDDVDAFIKNDIVINIKPYLRSMSRIPIMTEDELKELAYKILHQPNFDEVREWTNYELISSSEMVECIDWLNAHHFDYRGLIEKGLALEAPEGMYG